ncbi:hypothetical protein N0V88_000757 [Collariella sp. IMI 366227]|nr:hypothetical protein N0V88_000757 [Collariella sp. IMI 366227]
MEYKPQPQDAPPRGKIQPRLIIHGGAGNITPATLTPDRYQKFRSALLTIVTGPGGELQRSAGGRWGRTGEGQGGMIGIECVAVTDAKGNVLDYRSELLQDFNCGGMFRAWVDEKGVAFVRVFREDQKLPSSYFGEGRPENPRVWCGEK